MAILEGKKKKKQNVGFAFLLLGVIFALAPMPFFWWIGVTLGISGLVVVFSGVKDD
mgnify:FL=1